MSSRILAASVPSTPVRWKRVGQEPREEAAAQAPEQRGAAAGTPEQRPEGADTERRIEEAHRRGFVEGEARGRQTASQQVQAAVERLARSAAEFLALRPQARREAEEDVVQLALAVARRVLRRELTVDPGAILGLVKAAMEKLDARDLRRIRAHPETAALLGKYLQDAGLPERVEIVPDGALEKGAAILETARGSLDASVDTQVAEIERGFTDLMRGA